MEAFKIISHMFSVLALLPWFSDIISTSSLYLAATCSCALRQSTVAFGRISSIFYMKSGLRALRAVPHLGNLNINFYEQCLAVTACVSTETFGIISRFFST